MGTVRARELNTIQRKSPETVSRTSTRQKSPETGAIRQLETGRAGPQSSTLKKITGRYLRAFQLVTDHAPSGPGPGC
jgi:hypothetical protein